MCMYGLHVCVQSHVQGCGDVCTWNPKVYAGYLPQSFSTIYVEAVSLR